MKRCWVGIAAVIFCGMLVGVTPLQAQVSDLMPLNPLQAAERDYEVALANWGDGKSADNEALLNNALSIRTGILGPDHPLVADVVERLGAIDYNRGRYQLAEGKFRQALAIYTQSYGEQNIQTLHAMGDLGAALRQEARYAEAQKIVERSVALRRELLQPDSPALAGGLNNLGRIYLAQGRYAKARAALEESLRIFKSGGGGYEPNVRDDEALLNLTAEAETRLSRFLLWALAAGAVMTLLGALMIGCTVAAERAYTGTPPVLPPPYLVFLLTIVRLGLFAATALFGVAVTGVCFVYAGGNPNSLRAVFGAGALAAIVFLLPLWDLLTNVVRGKVGLPQFPVTIFGRQFGQPPLWEETWKPLAAASWFPAFEYHTFGANRTIKVFVTPHALCGARFSRLMSGIWTSPLQLTDAAFWTQSAQARAYDRLDRESEAFLELDEANFQIRWKEVSSLEYIAGRKWAAGSIPHAGRLIVGLRLAEPREFLLLGNQDGEALKRKLECLRAEDAARNTVGSPAATAEPSSET